ncbi:MAG: PIG-L family deacetylase [Oligoflexia bacterium]|nr:PIG-L family deacetylase [Oligoflexia bacterium]
MIRKKIMVVVAHPDDEILGCGGAIAKNIKEGGEVFSVILGEGITSRNNERDVKSSAKEIKELREHSIRANNVLGVKKVYFADFPDNRFDSVPLLDLVKYIENIKNEIRPDVVFTHFENDLNIDHQITYRAVLTATRPLREETVTDIYTFETVSSTEWNYPLRFSPNIYVDIDDYIELKTKAIAEYQTEMRNYPHPRSIEFLKENARYWGNRIGKNYVEPMICIRKFC